jgi:hypothetical protein
MTVADVVHLGRVAGWATKQVPSDSGSRRVLKRAGRNGPAYAAKTFGTYVVERHVGFTYRLKVWLILCAGGRRVLGTCA